MTGTLNPDAGVMNTALRLVFAVPLLNSTVCRLGVGVWGGGGVEVWRCGVEERFVDVYARVNVGGFFFCVRM